ncbi:MAG: F0F1 ATP synthase subunit C [Hyphomonas sp.]
MDGNIADGMKYIGAGLATLGMIGSAMGVGNIFASFLNAAMRNPSAAPQQTGNLFIGMALAEALGILSFLVAVLILFVV